jgi:hypothetical protein
MTKFLGITALSLGILLLCTAFADAQLFRRNTERSVQRTRTVTNTCPGGVCSVPTATTIITSRPATVSKSSLPTVSVPVPTASKSSISSPSVSAPTVPSAPSPTVSVPSLPQRTYSPTPSTPTKAPVLFGLGELTSSTDPIPTHVLAQTDNRLEVTRDSFKSELLKSVAEARKAGKISLLDAVRLRVAMLSPAFVQRAHELAVTQIAFSTETSEFVPVDEDGVIQVEGINWEGLTKFLEALIPLILMLLKAFGV